MALNTVGTAPNSSLFELTSSTSSLGMPAYPSLTGPRLSMGAIYEGDGGVQGL